MNKNNLTFIGFLDDKVEETASILYMEYAQSIARGDVGHLLGRDAPALSHFLYDVDEERTLITLSSHRYGSHIGSIGLENDPIGGELRQHLG